MGHVSCGIIFEDAANIDEITKNIIFISFILCCKFMLSGYNLPSKLVHKLYTNCSFGLCINTQIGVNGRNTASCAIFVGVKKIVVFLLGFGRNW